LVVEEMEGVVNVVPLPRATPPVGFAYQLIVPALAVADKLRVPASQRLEPVTPVIVGSLVTVAVTVDRDGVVHVPSFDST
jgi:hypothetical protein